MNKKIYLFLIALIFVACPLSAQMFLSEIATAPGGDDESVEFIELRGPANATIANNTFVVFVEGDNNDPGDVDIAFDISGLSFGSNGYLVLDLAGNPFTLAAGANEVTSSNDNWLGLPDSRTLSTTSNTSDLINSPSQTILLVTTTNDAVITDDRDDIDSDDDGEIDIVGWTIHDSISILDDDSQGGSTAKFGYGEIIYTQNIDGTMHPSGSTVIEVNFDAGYVSRIGESTGSTNDDWFYASTSRELDGGVFIGLDINSSSSDQGFTNEFVTELGGPSYVFTPVTFTGTEDLTAVDITQDLTLTTSFSTSSDLECHNLVINNGVTLTLEDAGSIDVYGSITINGTGSLIVESGGTLWTFSGKDKDEVTVQRNTSFSDARYSFVGTPFVSDPSITANDLGSFVFTYDETEDFGSDGLARWKSTNNVQLAVGVGYTQASLEQISLTGIPNDGTITTDITHTTSAANNLSDRGFNLVSNPYASAIEADELLQLPGAGSNDNNNDDVIDGSIWLWDDGGSNVERGDNGDYIVWNGLGDVTGSNSGRTFQGQIRSMQGFFVRMTNPGTATIEFNERMRGGGDNNDGRFFREETTEEPFNIKLSLQTADEKYYNELLVGYREDATEGLDRGYDAMKLAGNNNLQFYSFIDGEKYAIQGLPIEPGTETELGFDLGQSTELKLTVKELTGLAENTSLFLFDRITKNLYDLSEITSITFTSTAGTDQNRFILSFGSNVLSVDELSIEPLFNYKNNELSVIFDQSVDIESYVVYDLSGKVILTENFSLEQSNQLNIPISNQGINIIKLITNKGTFSRKFLFSN